MNRKINSVLALAIVAVFSFFIGVLVVVNVRSISQVSFINFSPVAKADSYKTNTKTSPNVNCKTDPNPVFAGLSVTLSDDGSTLHNNTDRLMHGTGKNAKNAVYQWINPAGNMICNTEASAVSNGAFHIPPCSTDSPRDVGTFNYDLYINDARANWGRGHCPVVTKNPISIVCTPSNDFKGKPGDPISVDVTTTDKGAPVGGLGNQYIYKWAVPNAQDQKDLNTKGASVTKCNSPSAGAGLTDNCTFTTTSDHGIYATVVVTVTDKDHPTLTNTVNCYVDTTQPSPNPTPTLLPPITH